MLWLVNGQVCDVERGRVQRLDLGLTLEPVDRGRIATVTKKAKPKADDRVVDMSGLYLLPGLIDCHVHLVLKPEDDVGAMERRTDAGIALYAAKAAAQHAAGWHHHVSAIAAAGTMSRWPCATRSRAANRIGPRLYLVRPHPVHDRARHVRLSRHV